jgi:cytochrome c551/c552
MVALRCGLAALVFGACSVGEVGGADGGMVTMGSQAVFDSTIKPMVTTKGCVACHSAAQPPNFTSYQTLLPQYRNGPPATNKLLTEAADGALHNGVTYFTTAEKMTITNWILGL